VLLQTVNMASERDSDPNFLRDWRLFRRMTQDELAAAVDTTAAVISLLETGQRQLSAKWLRRLAPALRTTPGFLLDHHPEDLASDVLEIWAAIPDADRPQAMRILETFRRTGTN